MLFLLTFASWVGCAAKKPKEGPGFNVGDIVSTVSAPDDALGHVYSLDWDSFHAVNQKNVGRWMICVRIINTGEIKRFKPEELIVIKKANVEKEQGRK